MSLVNTLKCHKILPNSVEGAKKVFCTETSTALETIEKYRFVQCS